MGNNSNNRCHHSTLNKMNARMDDPVVCKVETWYFQPRKIKLNVSKDLIIWFWLAKRHCSHQIFISILELLLMGKTHTWIVAAPIHRLLDEKKKKKHRRLYWLIILIPSCETHLQPMQIEIVFSMRDRGSKLNYNRMRNQLWIVDKFFRLFFNV